MKKIVAITEGRMTYGLLYWTLLELEQNPNFELHIVATGSHLSEQHGMTIKAIISDGFRNIHEIKSMVEDSEKDSKTNIAKAAANITLELSGLFEKINPDLMIILGDRFELLAAATVATSMNIPIAHICGGEVSEGAFDEQIRHALTKLSHLHFVGCEEYRQNIINLGEDSSKVFNFGEPGIENVKRLSFLSKEKLFSDLGIDETEKPLFLITYHPVTLERDGEKKIDEFISALEKFDAIQIITAPNQDHEGSMFLKKLQEYAEGKKNVYVFPSLGQVLYLSVMNVCDVVIGNSSSGIIETPSFKVPTVNIGNRQKGRLRSRNIIDCFDDKESIIAVVQKALSSEFKEEIRDMQSPFGDGDVSGKIVNELSKIQDYNKLLLKKLNWN